MKADTKINIIGWIIIAWSLIGVLRQTYLLLILLPLGIGILLRNNMVRIATIYFCFFWLPFF